jgi:hypothetical protein
VQQVLLVDGSEAGLDLIEMLVEGRHEGE